MDKSLLCPTRTTVRLSLLTNPRMEPFIYIDRFLRDHYTPPTKTVTLNAATKSLSVDPYIMAALSDYYRNLHEHKMSLTKISAHFLDACTKYNCRAIHLVKPSNKWYYENVEDINIYVELSTEATQPTIDAIKQDFINTYGPLGKQSTICEHHASKLIQRSTCEVVYITSLFDTKSIWEDDFQINLSSEMIYVTL